MDRRSPLLANAFTKSRRATLVLAVVACLAGSLVVSAAPALAKPTATASTTPAAVPISSAGPLTRVEISPDLNCAVDHTGDTSPEFYGDTACGTLVAVGGTLYGPASIPAGSSATGVPGYTPFTPVSQSAVTGAGTNADPYKIVTVVGLGSTGLQITQTDSYVVGQESYRTDVALGNSGGSPAPAIVYRAGDCYLQNSDRGFGASDATSGAVSCVNGVGSPAVPGPRIEQWFPLTTGSSFYESGYSTVWSKIGSQTAFANLCEQCANYIDNGAGLSWNVTAPAGGSVTVSHLTVFAPTGNAPLTMTKTAALPSVPAGTSDSYTITVSNSNGGSATLDSITDTLPAGFSYTSGSTTGATTTDPAVAGQVLTWSGPFTVPAAGSLSLTFGVTASSTPGTYTNVASAAAQAPFTVVGTGPTAPVTVTAMATAHLTLTKAVVNTGGGTAAATAWTLTATGPTSISGHTGDASITNAAVNAGTYTLAESGGPSGYSASAWSCTGGTLTGSSLVLAAGATASCGITNTFIQGGEPSLTINDVQGIEGDRGLRDFVFTVSRTGDTSGSASVHYHTRDGKAIAVQDYISIPDATLTFAPGEVSKDLVVQVVGDGKRANNEAFFVILSDPVGATIGDGRGRGTILKDDPYLKIRNAHVAEPSSGLVLIRFKVVLSYPTISDVTVHFSTRDGTATAGQDYVARTGTLTFKPGHSIKYVRVWVMADATQNSNETFFVDLSGATGPGGLIRIQDGTAQGTIR